MGRPREFDRVEALRVAMKLFWQRGFEGVSVSDLTAAMDIATPSFYAAFGSKATLYRETLECYQKRARALSTCPLESDLPLREAIERVLNMAIATVTELSPSPGCMIANGLLAVSPEHRELAELPASLRRGLIAALESRLQIAAERGELMPGTNAATLARYFAAIVQGISIQARDGSSEADLRALVRFALEMLPTPPRARTQQARAPQVRTVRGRTSRKPLRKMGKD